MFTRLPTLKVEDMGATDADRFNNCLVAQ